jgi:CRISPR-associated protein Cas1
MAIVQQLLVEQYGAFLGKHHGRLQVTVKDQIVAEAPLLHLEAVLILSNGVGLSSDAIRACCEAGIPIHFLSSRGSHYAALYSAGLTGTVQTRRAQLSAYDDRRGLALALGFTGGKIRNQAFLLRYMARYRQEHDPACYDEVAALADQVQTHLEELGAFVEAGCVDEVRERLLSVEGRAAQKYWDGVRRLLLADLDWPGRRTQEAEDPLNCALNYGYGILYGQVERALVLAGLDPYGGYLHTDRPGKPSLVLDLIEEFRQVVVDRAVIGLVNRKAALEMEEAGRLAVATRKMLAEHVLQRLESTERQEGERRTLRNILQEQARHLATFVRSERDEYRPFVAS